MLYVLNISKLKCAPFLYLARLGCGQGWFPYGNSCYYVIYTPTIKWNDARTKCQFVGGDLAIIRSQDENKFILGLLKNQPQVQIKSAWLGLYRNTSHENTFYWVDDTPLAGHYAAWAKNEPNSLHEKCVHIYAASFKPGEWNDKKCSLPVSEQSSAPVVLCQKRLMRL